MSVLSFIQVYQFKKFRLLPFSFRSKIFDSLLNSMLVLLLGSGLSCVVHLNVHHLGHVYFFSFAKLHSKISARYRKLANVLVCAERMLCVGLTCRPMCYSLLVR